MDRIGIHKEVKEIINYLGCKKFCRKLEEGVLHKVKDFIANLVERVDDKVLLEESGLINNLLEALEHEEDDYSVVMEEGLDINERVRKLCQFDK